MEVSHLPYSGNAFSTLQCDQRHLPGGSTLDSALIGDTDAATLAWLVSALEHARIRSQINLVAYLEAVADDVVFEVEAAAWRWTCVVRTEALGFTGTTNCERRSGSPYRETPGR